MVDLGYLGSNMRVMLMWLMLMWLMLMWLLMMLMLTGLLIAVVVVVVAVAVAVAAAAAAVGGGGGGGGVKTTMLAGYLLLILVWKKQIKIEFNIQMTIVIIRCNEKLFPIKPSHT